MKRIFTFLVLLFSLTLARAQVNSYSFSTSTGEALATGSFTNLLGTFLDDDVSALANIGFTFNYNNVNYTNFSVTSNGLLALGLGAVTDYNNVIANLSGPYIFPYWDDNYTDANGNVQYLVTGAVGSRKLVIEYNLSYLGNTGVADKKFQIWLFETSNIVQFVYGAGNDLNGGFSVGILSGSTDFHSVSVSSHTTSTVTTNDNNTTWPGSGRTYIFNPTPTVTPLSSAQSQTNVSCFGGSNGSATVTPSGGTLPYTYNWTPGNPAGDGTGSVSGLTAGTWTCTVTDAASLTIDVPVTVTQPTAISVTSASQSNVSCFGGSNGAASINAPTGGEGGYTYNWTPGNPTGDGTTSVTGLTAGTWTCTVTDINACNASVSFTLTEPTALIASSSATSISCFGGTSTVTVSATGGTTAYSGTGNFTVSAGTHTYNVSDMNGCTSNTTITVIQPEVVNAPIGNTSQTFCSALNATLASIQVTGTDIQWYDSNTGGQILATSTPLVTGTTYYATQTLGGCESPSYLAVTITLTVASAYYADLDGDGYGAGAATNACTQPVGYVLDNTDCDDNNSSASPIGTEVCGNGIDEDCSGADLICVVPGCTDVTACNYNSNATVSDGSCTYASTWYLDSDGDTYGTSASANATLLINENFDNIATSLSSGWSQQNLSSPIGTLTYFQADPIPFTSHSGATNSYAAVNFNSGAGTAVISNWLFSPEVNLVNGAQFSFWTRTVDEPLVYPDRLQLRLSTAGASSNVGTSSTSEGDFSNLLIDVNPTYTTTGYPIAWTQYTVTLSGISEPVTGRFAFRYFVEGGGPLGANSNYIGIDDVSYTVPANVVSTCSGAPVSYVSSNTDCNDSNSTVNPGATEVCNSIDDDCDTQIDEGVQNNYYADLDGDGYGAGAATNACTQPVGYVLDNTDCDDNNSSISPAGTEVCGNGIDEDCDGSIDEVPGTANAWGQNQWLVNVYQGSNFDNYSGYYIRNGVSYDTQSDFCQDCSPSSSAGYIGCPVTSDDHSYKFRREGFAPSVYPYAITIPSWDDDVQVWVDGVSVWSAGCCASGSNSNIVWTGTLNASSTVEISLKEYGGGSFASFVVEPQYPLSITGATSLSQYACYDFNYSAQVTQTFNEDPSTMSYTLTSANGLIDVTSVVPTFNGSTVSFTLSPISVGGVDTLTIVVNDLMSFSDTLNVTFYLDSICPPALDIFGDSQINVDACTDFSLFVGSNSILGYSSQDLTYSVTFSDTSYVQSTTPDFIDYWGSQAYVFFNATGQMGSTLATVIVSDPMGNSDTLLTTVNFGLCSPEVLADFPSVISCGDSSLTMNITYAFNIPGVEQSIATIGSSNTNFVPNENIVLLGTSDTTIVVNNISFYGTTYSYGVTFSQLGAWLEITGSFSDTLNFNNSFWFSIESILDENAPILTASSDTVEVVLAPGTCDTLITWDELLNPVNAFGQGSTYLTNQHDGTFYAAVNSGSGMTEFGVDGNSGIDGNGEMIEGNFPVTTSGGANFNVYYGQSFDNNGGDPKLYHLIFVPSSETGVTTSVDFNMDDDRFVVGNLSGTPQPYFYYLFASSQNAVAYNDSTLQLVAQQVANGFGVYLNGSGVFDLTGLSLAMGTVVSDVNTNILNDGNYYTIDIVDDFLFNGNNQPIGIDDGGNDIYDSGNYLVSNFNNYYQNNSITGIPYTNGLVAAGGPSEGASVFSIIVNESCDYELTSSIANGSSFGLGATDVLYTATDNSGNTTQYTVVVNVVSGVTASEICNNIDDDCDSQIDEDLPTVTYYADADGDGYGAMSGMTTQGNATVVFTSTGLIINGSNELMSNMNIQGGAQFVVPADAVYTFDWSYTTNDVDGASLDPAYYINGVLVQLTDDLGADAQSGSVSVNVTAGSTFGFEIIAEDNVLGEASLVITNFNAISNFTGIQSCGPVAGYVTVGGDCNDNLAGTNPGASEICNTSDDDCDGLVDDGQALTTYYLDMDMDGYGGTNSVQSCSSPSPVYVAQGGDCEDFNMEINPGATEICNNIDEDCDTQIDEGVLNSYYADLDNDGYGAGTATNACTAPVGFVSSNTDCNDNSSAVNPGASEICNLIDDDCNGTADDGIPVINYYSDLDGDSYGGALITSTCASLTGNFVVVGGDCNDSNTAINPGVAEICLNSIDDDCDGTINDGCAPDELLAESPATAVYAWTTFHPSCITSTHTLAGFSPSLSAQTICLTGEDKWHYFTATSEAVSIQVASSANDILLELQNAAGTLIATENAVSGLGGEILNYSGLVSGQVYKVGVRNYNSALGIGSYTLCVKMLKRGGCDYGPGPYSLCQYFKATYGGTGTTYTFTFTGVSGNASGNVYTRTQTSDICVLSNVSPSLPYGSTYNVLITSTYTLLDGAGNPEVIAVPGLSPCTMSTVSQPATSLRTSDQCVNGTRFRGSVVASLPWVCGVTNWRWEFTEVNPFTYATVGLPIALNRGAASNYINLGTVAALQNGKTYAVRTAPILASTGTNYQWGATYYLCIIGSAGIVVENNNASASDTKSEIANEANMSLYPNPTHGTDVNINLSGIESENVQIRIVDAMGKQVWSNRYTVNGVLNTNITFERPLANGLYFVEAIFNGEVQTQRMMVQK